MNYLPAKYRIQSIIRIGNIVNDSPAEVKDRFSDIIYCQGCERNCKYCFNKELKDFNKGIDMKIEEIISKLSDFSDVVVITGGEPLYQYKSVRRLIEAVKNNGRKVVLETSFIDTKYAKIYELCDKVLLTFKTFDIPKDFEFINETDNIIPCVVIGHQWFNWEGYIKILEKMKFLYFRFYNDKPRDFTKVWRMAKERNVQLKKFDKIIL